MIYNICDILEGDLLTVMCNHFGDNHVHGSVENTDAEYDMVMFNYKSDGCVQRLGIYLNEIVGIPRLDEEFGENIKNALVTI